MTVTAWVASFLWAPAKPGWAKLNVIKLGNKLTIIAFVWFFGVRFLLRHWRLNLPQHIPVLATVLSFIVLVLKMSILL